MFSEDYKPVVFATESGENLVDRLLSSGNYTRGRKKRDIFPDGERYQRKLSHVTGRDVLVIGEAGTYSNTLELYDLSCALVKYGCRSLHIIVSARGGASTEENMSVLKSVPKARQGTRIVSWHSLKARPVPAIRFPQVAPRRQPVLLSTVNYRYLKEKIAERGNFELGRTFDGAQLNIQDYDDVHGTTSCTVDNRQELKSDVDNRDVVIVGGTVSDEDTMELYWLGHDAVAAGARSLTLVIPYFGYSTMERAVKSGEVVTAKTRARLLSSLRQAKEGNRIVLMDLHSEGIPHYFEGPVGTFHTYCEGLICRTIKRLGKGKNYVVASADAGRSKWVQALANRLGVLGAFVLKRRLSGSKTEVMHISADVKGKTVFLFDDMIRTGGSALEAGKAYRAAGASEVYLIATHGVFPGNALEKLVGSGVFQQVIVTDSHHRAWELRKQKGLKVISVAGLLAGVLERGPKV